MSLRLYGEMKERKKCSEPLILLQKKESRMKEETKMTTTENLSPSAIQFVAGVYKGSDMTLGEAVTQALQYEEEQNAWIDMIEVKEGLRR